MLRVSQVASRLNCSVSTVYALIESGRLDHFRCPGVRISEEQLSAYLEKSKRVRGPATTRRTTGSRPVHVKHLNAERLAAAWKTQGID